MTYLPTVFISLLCAAVSLPHTVTSVPASQLHRADDDATPGDGIGTVLWSMLDGCFDSDAAEPLIVCLKYNALTALDRTFADGVPTDSTRRDGRSLQAERADRDALEAVKNSDHKSALLSDMLASRLAEFVSSRANVLYGSDLQEEGRGKKKKQKAIMQSIIIASVVAFAVLGPMAASFIGLLAGKALLFSKIALVLTSLMSVKKLFSSPKSSHDSSVAYDRNFDINPHNSHNMAYSGQKY